MQNYAWNPYGDYIINSRVKKFMDFFGIKTADELIQRSTTDIKWFWPAAMNFLGVEWFKKWHTLYDQSNGMPWTKWFLGGKTNITYNCLDRHIMDGKGRKTALIFESDHGASCKVTYGELDRVVKKLSRAMILSGITRGDRIAMCMSISPEAVAVMLAAFKIGAVCMQPASRISADEMAESLLPGSPKLLFMHDGYQRGGKTIKLDKTYHAVRNRIPSLHNIVVYGNYLKSFVFENPRKYTSWNLFLKEDSKGRFPKTEACDAEDPALILYSSGTTGKSKIIVHTHGGILAQVPKEVGFAFDCQENDVFFWFTNIGWMMAPWEIIGALFFGATVVLYEGTHLYPNPHRMFELIEKHKISIFGFTPSAMTDLAASGEDFSRHDLSSLRILGSTGKVLHPNTWEWYFQTFGKSRLPIMNISGGTELIGCMVSPLPVMPQNPGTVGGPGLGMDVDVVDKNNNPVRGSPGYLVCKKPAPSMTRGFLADNDRYLKTHFPWGQNLWVHGDMAEIGEDGLWYMRGRADDLIVKGGIKLDPSKIESALLKFPGPPQIREAAVIGVPDEHGDQKIVCFAILAEHNALDEAAIITLKRWVKNTYEPFARPDEIHAVSGLPTNLAAKVPLKILRMAYAGEKIADTSKIVNPQYLEEIRTIGERVRKKN